VAVISHNPKSMISRIARIPILFLWLAFGLVLILVPWTEIWETNYFLYQYPALGIFLKNSFLRGAISGLGVMNVLLALEGFRQRDAGVESRT
jgi:hypothetical protein